VSVLPEKRRGYGLLIFLSLIFLLSFFPSSVLSDPLSKGSLLIYVGAASKPPTEEVAGVFEKKTGIRVHLNIGSSGAILSQLKLTRRGDIYFPGSSDYMELAKREGLVFPETEARVVYLVPAINVQRGNPKKIQGLKDLTRPGVRVAIANPESVCVGVYAVETIERAFSQEEKAAFRRNIRNYPESCEKTATIVALRAVDAVIGWSVFEHWDLKRIQTIPLKPEEVTRIGYIPAAIARYTNHRALAQQFLDFIASPEGKAVYKKYHYFITPEEAFAWIGSPKPVGGEYVVPGDWLTK